MKSTGWSHIAIARGEDGEFGEVRFVSDPDPEQIARLWFEDAHQIVIIPLEDATQYTKVTTEVWQ